MEVKAVLLPPSTSSLVHKGAMLEVGLAGFGEGAMVVNFTMGQGPMQMHLVMVPYAR